MSRSIVQYVYDRSTAKPMMGVACECYRTDTGASVATGTTDADGKVTFTGLSDTLTYKVVAKVRGDLRVFDERASGSPNLRYSAAASGNLTITNAYQDVVGATVTLGPAGVYVILGNFEFGGTSSAAPGVLTGQIVVDGVAQAPLAVAQLAPSVVDVRMAGTMCIVTTASAGLVAKLQAKNSAIEGTYYAYQVSTTILALKVA